MDSGYRFGIVNNLYQIEYEVLWLCCILWMAENFAMIKFPLFSFDFSRVVEKCVY